MKINIIIISLLFSIKLVSQDRIELNNPSFEGISRCCAAPQKWKACGDENFNSPDIQPGHFNVWLTPYNGETYLGLVTRDIDSWESVSQKLNSQIQSGKKYIFSIFLAQAPNFISQSRLTNKDVKYNQPIKLRIWGSNNYCDKNEMLGESSIVDHEDWQEYEFVFQPKENYSYIIFEAFYNTPTPTPYNGHILLDNCSAIKEL